MLIQELNENFPDFLENTPNIADLQTFYQNAKKRFDEDKDFQKKVILHRKELRNLMVRLKKQGKKIHIYGASTKGNTILQWCRINHKLVDFAAERNPQKHGLKTLGTNIPIISEDEMRKNPPDYMLVLPWHFINEFINREKVFLQSGGKFIVPCPKFEIIG